MGSVLKQKDGRVKKKKTIFKKNSHKLEATTNTQGEDNRLTTGRELGVGDGWLLQHN